MTFSGAQSYLLGLINEHASRREPNRLDRIRAFVRELGDPHLRYPTVHVAGTSGKGSTATMVAAAFRAAGKRVGLHTKPHLSSVTERIAHRRRAAYRTSNSPNCLELDATGDRPRHDERTGGRRITKRCSRLAFVAFAQADVDVAVIEAGIGGRLDGTNVLQPIVSAITNVSLDHTEILGETTAEIAADKAGIAKTGVPLVSDARDADARREIEAACAAVGAPFVSVADTVTIEAHPGERYGQSFDVVTPLDRYALSLPVLGAFQQRNAATAIRMLEQLDRTDAADTRRDRGGPRAIGHPRTHGILSLASGSRLRRRAQSATKPRILREHSRKHSRTDVSRSLSRSRRAKDVAAILEPFVALPATYTFTSFDVPGRTATRPQRLAAVAESLGIWGRAIADPVDAFSVARRNADACDIVVVTGSTFVVATLRDWWLANVARPVSRIATRGAHRAARTNAGVGRAHLRDGHRQRLAGFVFGRRRRQRRSAVSRARSRNATRARLHRHRRRVHAAGARSDR